MAWLISPSIISYKSSIHLWIPHIPPFLTSLKLFYSLPECACQQSGTCEKSESVCQNCGRVLTQTHTHKHHTNISTEWRFPPFTFLMRFLSSFVPSFPMSLYLPLPKKKKSLEKKHNSCKSHTNQMRNINLNTEGKTSQRLNEDESESKSKQHNNLKPSLKMLNRPTIIKDVFWIWTRWHANTHTQSEAVLLWLNGFGPNWHGGVKTLPHGLTCILTLSPHRGCVWPDLFLTLVNIWCQIHTH